MNNKNKGLPAEVLINLARTESLADSEKDQLLTLLSKGLDSKESEDFLSIIKGEKLPSLSSDVIAKKIFDPEEHPERLEYLLQNASGENDIHVVGPAKMEGYVGFYDSKRLIHDIPAMLDDGRISDTEVQVKAQEFIFPRAELYGSDLLLIQYSAKRGDKASVTYENVNGVLLLILMSESPNVIRNYQTERYIHRFDKRVADSGLSYEPLCKTVYIQLDKALEQLKEGLNGEEDLRLQLLLAAMKDINDPFVRQEMEKDDFFSDIIEEVTTLSQDKEVQIMLLAEKYAMADIATMKSMERAEGRAEGGNDMLYRLVQNGRLSVFDGAEEMGVTEDTFLSNMKLCGFEPPKK